MNRKRRGASQAGLTLIEVLVSVAILGIVAAALLATVSVIVRLNREAAVEIDYSRVVRTAVERIKLDWQIPDEWNNQLVAKEPLDGYVRARSDNACGAVIVSETNGVRVVRITCSGDNEVPDQVYHVEFGEK